MSAHGAAAGLLGGLAAAPFGEPLYIAASAALAAAMAAIAVEDLRRFRVPDRWNLFAAVAGLAAAWVFARTAGDAWRALGASALAGVLCAGVFFLLREAFLLLRGVDGLGLGDVKLAATGGIWLGGQTFPVAVMLAALSALAYVALRHRRDGVWPRERRIPFALHLAPAIWACWYVSAVQLVVGGGVTVAGF